MGPSTNSVQTSNIQNIGTIQFGRPDAFAADDLFRFKFGIMRIPARNEFDVLVSPVFMPSHGPSLQNHVARVISMRSKEEMGWSNAMPDVAFVADKHSRRNFGHVYRVGYAMSEEFSGSANRESSISSAFGYGSGPHPTRTEIMDDGGTVLVDLSPKIPLLARSKVDSERSFRNGSGRLIHSSSVNLLSKTARINGRSSRSEASQVS